MITLRGAAAEAAARLQAAGVPADEARRDAVVLARAVLGWDAAAWLLRQHDSAPPEFSDRYESMIARRARREPVAYILGEREFYGRTFMVSAGVLVPRPETEFVIDEALAGPEPRTIVDVGTGSGCLAITLALERPAARIVATDISEPALRIARRNAAIHGVQDRIDFRHGALLAGFAGLADLIVSNPPYVPDGDRPVLPPEVIRYEPESALFGGADGLDVARQIFDAAARLLVPGGRLILEFGFGQAAAIESIARAHRRLEWVRMVRDLQQIPRVAVVQRRAEVP